MLDNVTVMSLLVVTMTKMGQAEAVQSPGFTREFVLTYMIPGTALGVLIGDLVYTWMAFRLARRTGRYDVTAMPLGLDTPSTFGMALLVLLPALEAARQGMTRLGRPLDHDNAMLFAWHVGVIVLVLIGLFKVVCAPLGNAVRRWVPRAGLLGSLAAIAVALIAFVPMLLHIAPVPLVGLGALMVILITLVAHRPLPFQIPGALAAILVGVGLYYGLGKLGDVLGVPLIPAQQPPQSEAWRPPPLVPFFSFDVAWWQAVLLDALTRLPVALPFALATIVGGIDCTESAAAAGDEYDTGAVLLTEGAASVAAAFLGGVIQTTPYIGHPAYKTMGGRAAYTLATALFVGGIGYFGVFALLFHWLPEPALFPILVFVGLEITAQSFRATPQRQYPALALAMLPTLAYLATIPLNEILGSRLPQTPRGEAMALTLYCLSNGFIVTSLLWAAALASLLDGRLRQSAAYLLVAGGCALVGIIHSPLPVAVLDWPWHVIAQMPKVPALLCQSPYHWAGAYFLAASLLFLLSCFRPTSLPNR
jgi:AGZA family xanthine/uracil permease-like MFS transporter